MNPNHKEERKLSAVKSVAVTGNIHQDEYISRIIEFIKSLLSHGLEVWVRQRFYNYLDCKKVLPAAVKTAEDVPDVDAVISIGGDGTFIKTAKWVGSHEIPILGLNTGHLGFLANFSIEEFSSLPEALTGGNSVVESRILLQISCRSLPQDFYPYALNEVALLKAETSSMITADVSVDGNFLATYRADGLIVSTPTGSTAYNLSVGGPIVHPEMKSMVISPVAPHTLTLRPMVLSSDSSLSVVVSSRAGDFRVSVDGNSFTLPCSETLKISRAPFNVLTIRRYGDNFAAAMRNKLHWGIR